MTNQPIRHTRSYPCPVCGGFDEQTRGRGLRCHGFTSADGRWAHCSREEHAGGIEKDSAGTFGHHMKGSCRCGRGHNGTATQSAHTGTSPPFAPRILNEVRYPLIDEAGQIMTVHVRRELEGGDKTFFYDPPIKPRGIDRDSLPLYGLPDLLKAPKDVPVIVVEGEKKCDVLKKAGFLAVATATGAGGKPKIEVLRPLVGRPVFLWSDHDDEGRSHMAWIAAVLASLRASPKIIRWTGAMEKGDDAADFIDRGGTAADLQKLMAEAKEWNAPALPDTQAPLLVRLSDVEPVKVRWLWPGRIPLGKITVLDGDPSLGKTLIAIDLAARVSRGQPMPDDTVGDLGGPSGVVILSAEDDPADTLRPRLDSAGGDPSKVVMLAGLVERIDAGKNPDGTPRFKKRERLPNLGDIEAIRRAVTETGACLVFVDPFMAYLDGADAHVDSEIRSLLMPLAKLAAELGVAIVLIRHLRKAASTNPIYSGGGSIAIIAAARSGLVVAADPEDETGERRLLAVTKANLAVKAGSLLYRVEAPSGVPVVAWLGKDDRTAADLLSPPEKDKEDRSAAGEAADFLRQALSNGPRPAKTLQKEAKDAGVSWSSVKRAKAKLEVRSRKGAFDGGEWTWSLPEVDQTLPPWAVGPLDPLHTPSSESNKPATVEGDQASGFASFEQTTSEPTPKPKSAKETKRPKPPSPCRACGETRRWKSAQEVVQCGSCHPPATPELVVEWLE